MMHPEIIKLGPIIIRSYGLMLALSFFVGVIIVRYRARKIGVDPEFVVNLSFIVILAGVIGARLFYAFYHWSDFSGNLLGIFNPFGSSEGFGIAGLNKQGGLLLAFLSAIGYCLVKKQPVAVIFDLFAPAVALGIFITRIGCFLNGCCFGTECDLPWAVRFPEGSIPYSYFGDVRIHPAQLYSSLSGLVLFFVLSYAEKKKTFVGLTFSLFLILEGVFRYLIESVRYYEYQMKGEFFGHVFTYNQIVAILMFLAGWGLMLFFRARARSRSSSLGA